MHAYTHIGVPGFYNIVLREIRYGYRWLRVMGMAAMATGMGMGMGMGMATATAMGMGRAAMILMLGRVY